MIDVTDMTTNHVLSFRKEINKLQTWRGNQGEGEGENENER